MSEAVGFGLVETNFDGPRVVVVRFHDEHGPFRVELHEHRARFAEDRRTGVDAGDLEAVPAQSTAPQAMQRRGRDPNARTNFIRSPQAAQST